MRLTYIRKWAIFSFLNIFHLILKLLNKNSTHKIHVKYRFIFHVNFMGNSIHLQFTWKCSRLFDLKLISHEIHVTVSDEIPMKQILREIYVKFK